MNMAAIFLSQIVTHELSTLLLQNVRLWSATVEVAANEIKFVSSLWQLVTLCLSGMLV